MALTGWLLDKSAAVRAGQPGVQAQIAELAGRMWICEMGCLEQLFSARSSQDYDQVKRQLAAAFSMAAAPADVLVRALRLQEDLAHHHGMWHRTALPDLVIAETALHHGLGVVHVDSDYERIAEIRPLRVRRLKT